MGWSPHFGEQKENSIATKVARWQRCQKSGNGCSSTKMWKMWWTLLINEVACWQRCQKRDEGCSSTNMCTTQWRLLCEMCEAISDLWRRDWFTNRILELYLGQHMKVPIPDLEDSFWTYSQRFVWARLLIECSYDAADANFWKQFELEWYVALEIAVKTGIEALHCFHDASAWDWKHYDVERRTWLNRTRSIVERAPRRRTVWWGVSPPLAVIGWDDWCIVERVVLILVVKIARAFRDEHSSELDLLFFRRNRETSGARAGQSGK